MKFKLLAGLAALLFLSLFLHAEQASSPGVSESPDAKPIDRFGIIRWLDADEVEELPLVQFRAKALRDDLSLAPKLIGTREEAFNRFYRNMGIACAPTVACEDEVFYYFSGGTTAHPVTDFSKGILVEKATGEIGRW